MLYLWLKYIHILSSTLLFGTGLGTACVLLYGHSTKNISTMAVCNQYVVLVDWLFTGISGFIQALTGFWMIYLAGYSFKSLWIWGAITGYTFTACCWFPVVYFQIKLRDIIIMCIKNKTSLPAEYHYYFRWWFFLGWPAFISLLIVFYFMIMKPM
ncbi:integral membrane protein [Legionella donaldsonii]|uniref:Integral membrane protein n=1 Tax=Legionella donaldsonii TaxID=45060 RepID=A0A378J8G7_9GAMM|nr:DUF2269 domain-containing protein [Legionella donaldsonii]STX43217.1 integral membrane protein [Legionella donaldsonii]